MRESFISIFDCEFTMGQQLKFTIAKPCEITSVTNHCGDYL